jgi:hypothetical protein
VQELRQGNCGDRLRGALPLGGGAGKYFVLGVAVGPDPTLEPATGKVGGRVGLYLSRPQHLLTVSMRGPAIRLTHREAIDGRGKLLARGEINRSGCRQSGEHVVVQSTRYNIRMSCCLRARVLERIVILK